MVISVTSRGQCLYTHQCIVILCFQSVLIIIIIIHFIWHHLAAGSYRLQRNCHFTWTSGQFFIHLYLYKVTVWCDHSDFTAEICESSKLCFRTVRPGLYSSCSQGVWNFLTKPYGENKQSMSNFVMFFSKTGFLTYWPIPRGHHGQSQIKKSH